MSVCVYACVSCVLIASLLSQGQGAAHNKMVRTNTAYIISPAGVSHPGLNCTDSDKASLVILGFWVDAERSERIPKLSQVVESVREWRGGAHVVLVSNEHVPGILVDEQVIRPKPACVTGTPDNLCEPWEAIRLLKECGRKGRYSNFAYFEGDIKVPGATFDFWQQHVEELHAAGFLLQTHRRFSGIQEVLTDCFTADTCGEAIWYKPSKSFGNCPKDRSQVYFLESNPYAGGFMMNKAQFQEYLLSPESEYSTARFWWGNREMASDGLLMDSKYGVRKAVTHADMRSYHLLPAHGNVPSHPISEMEMIVADCLSTCNCSSMSI